MFLFWVIAILAGVAGVIQSGVTRKLATTDGLANAIHVSNALVFVGGVIVLSSILWAADGDFVKVLRGTKFEWSWWLLVPGACGLTIVVLSPYLVGRIGALPVFVSMIFGQVLGSALWDWKIEGEPLDRSRLIAVTLSLASALVLALSKGSK